MKPPSQWYGEYRFGVLCLTAICGLIDAMCFLALGGVFAELMTGNLMLLAFSLGGWYSPASGWLAYVAAIIPFVVGAFAAGFFVSKEPQTARKVGFTIEWTLVLAATVMVIVLADQIDGGWLHESMANGDAGPQPGSVNRMLIVGVLAFAMGIHNALMRKHAVPDIATNVMTLTLAGVASESPLTGDKSGRWKPRAASVAVFFAGALAGALLLRVYVGLPLIVASVLFTIALRPLVSGRLPGAAANRTAKVS